MSVPVNERSRGKLEVCVKARALCVYTLKITANKKIFSVEYQEALTDKIIATALDIHMLCWSANNVFVNSIEDMTRRNELQEQAAIQCNNLLSLIDIAKPIFHLSARRVEYWGGLVLETRNLIRTWRSADYARYKVKLGV